MATGGGILNKCWIQQKRTKMGPLYLKGPWALSSLQNFLEFIISKCYNSKRNGRADNWNIWENAWCSESWQIACLSRPRSKAVSQRERQSHCSSTPSCSALPGSWFSAQDLGGSKIHLSTLNLQMALFWALLPAPVFILFHSWQFDTYPQTLREVRKLAHCCPATASNKLCCGNSLDLLWPIFTSCLLDIAIEMLTLSHQGD